MGFFLGVLAAIVIAIIVLLATGVITDSGSNDGNVCPPGMVYVPSPALNGVSICQ